MIVSAVATIYEEAGRENLKQCIEILGGHPIVDGTSVGVDFTGSPKSCEKFIELYEQFPKHNITVIS